MELTLHSSRLSVSPATKAYLERRLSFALGRFADVISGIDVRLEDINGPRGGIDKRCRIRVMLSRISTPALAEVVDHEIRAAIDIAANRVGRSVARQLDRRQGRRVQRAMDSAPAAEAVLADWREDG